MMMKEFADWAFSRKQRERTVSDVVEKMQMSMRVTAKCRYNAANRLQKQGTFAFITTTIFSLGLILIPLMQNAKLHSAFNENILSMAQVFLAVAILVYSVVIGTAHYEVRAEKLSKCGDKIKELIRSLEAERAAQSSDLAALLVNVKDKYATVVGESENHSRGDYRLAKLEMRNDYFITGLPRLFTWTAGRIDMLIPFILPAMMLIFEIAFILDMVGLTHFFGGLVGHNNG